jgi:hypothetical protein
MDYRTQLPVGPVASPALRQQAAQALTAPSPFAFPGSHQDVYSNLASQNATAFDRAATQADAETMQQQRNTQMQMALRGLEQMAQAQDNSRSLAMQAYNNRSGFLNSLLQGLY